MVMDFSSPKLQFKLRPLINFCLVFCIFVVVAMLVAPLPWAWLIDAGLIAALYFVYFYILDKRTIELTCPKCDKYVATNTPWICGFCERKNENIDDFPFVHRCEHCGAEPKAYKCHYRACGTLIFLGQDRSEDGYARSAAVPLEPVEDPKAKTIEAEEEQKRKIQHDIIVEELNAKLNDIKQRVELGKKKSPQEKLEESFNVHQVTTMGARKLAREKKKANEVEYANDPDGLKEANEAVDDWLRSMT